jgi:hypothetical protein
MPDHLTGVQLQRIEKNNNKKGKKEGYEYIKDIQIEQ